jgi:Anti-sigma factor N-terminus
MNKAIIVEVSSRHLIVLAEGGEFKKIKNTNAAYTVGQEISLPVLKERKDSIFSVIINWKTGTAMALAIILLFFQVLSPLLQQGAYAYVGMNMDPSLELKIDEDMHVLNIFSFNEQGDTVLNLMGEWENKDIAYVTNLIFEACEDLGYLKKKEEVLITTTLSEDIPEEKEIEMKKRVNKVMTQTAKKKSVEMTTIVISSKEREKAKKMKISPGHYAIYTAAKKSGIKITAKEVSNHTIEEISEKVGPIKELLDKNDKSETVLSNKEDNRVYEPPHPILDQKGKDKAINEKSEKPAKVQTTHKEQPAKPHSSQLIMALEPKKEEKVKERVKKEPEKLKDLPLTAAGSENTNAAKPSEKDVQAAIPPKNNMPKEEKIKEEKPKEEKPKDDKTRGYEQPSSDPEEPVQHPQPEPVPKQENWIYIEIIIDGMIITVRIESDSNLLTEDLTKQALALINQNLLSQNQSLGASTKQPEGTAQIVKNTNCGQEVEPAKNTAEYSPQKAV